MTQDKVCSNKKEKKATEVTFFKMELVTTR